MKTGMTRLIATYFLLLALAVIAVPQQTGGDFAITASVIAGGGGRSTSGPFAIDATIGQEAAGARPSSGAFALSNGFWNFAASAQPNDGVSVSGRVFTPQGLALRNAIVVMTDPLGAQRQATTSSFGVYQFDNVVPGQTYIMSVRSKRYRFAAQFTSVSNDLTNVDFVGLE
jgi:hypothetical protein